MVKSIKKDGWAILNAEDEQCLKIANEISCNVAYFSLDENNRAASSHGKELVEGFNMES